MAFKSKEEQRAYGRAWHNGLTGEKRRKRMRQIRGSAAKRRAISKEYADSFKRKGCTDCGNSDLRVLDFDHLPGTVKKREISRMIRDPAPFKMLQEEIAKCEVVCSNCHRIRTHDRRV